MKTVEPLHAAQLPVPPATEELHPTVQAFVEKKVEQARENLKGIDVSVLRHKKKQ